PTLLAKRAGSGRMEIFAQIVATAAGATSSGRWTRPDVAAVAISRGDYIPYWRADLHTFEVKTARGLDATAVHEANSHGRFGHFAWFFFQAVGAADRAGSLYADVLTAASFVGVGVISFVKPDDPGDWVVDQWPIRTSAENAVADAFVGERFGNAQQNRIR